MPLGRFAALGGVLVVVVILGIAVGPVGIPVTAVVRALLGGKVSPVDEVIINQIRLPAAITAVCCGAALGVAGLQLQTLFRNPLADPFVLGVSSGASLGVALVVLLAGSGAAAAFGSGFGIFSQIGAVLAAWVGAGIVMALVLAAGRAVRSSNTLLLMGVMLGYLVSALVTVLLAGASPQQVQQYIAWGFGSYDGVTWSGLHVLAPVIAVSLLAAAASTKILNAMLMGERYATTMGVNVRRARLGIITTASVLGGTVTAFAGPIAFLGIAIPHAARSLLRTADHRVLIPACMLIGGSMALAANIVADLPGTGILPLNAVNAVVGAPVVVYVLVRADRKSVQS